MMENTNDRRHIFSLSVIPALALMCQVPPRPSKKPQGAAAGTWTAVSWGAVGKDGSKFERFGAIRRASTSSTRTADSCHLRAFRPSELAAQDPMKSTPRKTKRLWKDLSPISAHTRSMSGQTITMLCRDQHFRISRNGAKNERLQYGHELRLTNTTTLTATHQLTC